MTDLADALATVERERHAALERIRAAASADELDEAEAAALGRKAPMSALKRELGRLAEDDRRALGRALNEARVELESAISERASIIAQQDEARMLEADRLDVTLPGRAHEPGHPHPLTLVTHRVVDVFVGMGYRVAEGPEVETDFYNFEALNMPPDHPARSMHDTLYVEGGKTLLRTHTSPVQVRTMMAQPPPVYVIVPGRVYRRDPFDATHSPVFQQVEGLAVDRDISFADLKGTLVEFARALLGLSQRIRMRPSYFPFTEPSAEVDVACPSCEGEGCTRCGHSGWVEIMGAGMVHPNELRAVGYDPEEVSGFAFGLGVERVAMRLYGVRDIRAFYENDLRFLEAFSG